MVKEINCNIFEAPIDILVESKNCFGLRGGLAGEIARRFPETAENDDSTIKGSEAKLGTLLVTQLHQPKTRIKCVIGIYGQYHISSKERQTNYEFLYRGLEGIRYSVTNTDLVIGIPYGIGCGLGLASWSIVSAMIADVFGDSPFSVLVCRWPIPVK